MQVLITGRGTSGSWQIRGVQLGKAIGATVIPEALDVAAFDLAVIVKRPSVGLLERLRRAGVPIVYDVVDAWPQPAGNEWHRRQCLSWFSEQRERINPAAVVCATKRMADDLGGFWLRHHHRPGIAENPIRDRIKVIGYEGGENYLGRWRPFIEKECRRRGWSFVINPQRLSDVDVVLAVRDHSGYAPKHWKSNVKLANAQGSGTPVICNREAGYLETESGGEQWADTEDELLTAFDELTTQDARLEASCKLKSSAPSLEMIATEYRRFLARLTA